MLDYLALAEELQADLLDYAEARRRSGRVGRLIERAGGANALLAWATFRAARRYEAVLTDGEQVGLPYAALCRLRRRSRLPRHSMIVHIMSVRKKVLLFKSLRLRDRIDALIVYSSSQQDFATTELGVRADRVYQTTFMVDCEFFSPDVVEPAGRRMICSAGLEFRDYETLVAAVDGLDVDVVIAAASPWSKRASTIEGAAMPSNVSVTKLSLADLRQLYADALFVVMPLVETDFQAGITTILEAMAMGKAVVCTRTRGQTDTIVDEVTGLYVPVGDSAAWRTAIQRLLDDPVEMTRLGAAGRERVEQTADLPVYAKRLAEIVRPKSERVFPCHPGGRHTRIGRRAANTRTVTRGGCARPWRGRRRRRRRVAHPWSRPLHRR